MVKRGPTDLIYTETEDAFILAGHNLRMNAEQIAKRLPGRTMTSVYVHAKDVLGITLPVTATPEVGYAIPKTGHLGVRAKDAVTRARWQAQLDTVMVANGFTTLKDAWEYCLAAGAEKAHRK